MASKRSGRGGGVSPLVWGVGLLALFLLVFVFFRQPAGQNQAATSTATPALTSAAADAPAQPAAQSASVVAAATDATGSADAPAAQAASKPTKTPTPKPKAKPTATAAPTRGSPPKTIDGLPTITTNELPPEALDTLALIEAGGPFPFSKDGTVFQNREGILPSRRSGYYHEYTVITPGEGDRGARRIIEGAGGELYYTDDHYDSFSRIVTQ